MQLKNLVRIGLIVLIVGAMVFLPIYTALRDSTNKQPALEAAVKQVEENRAEISRLNTLATRLAEELRQCGEKVNELTQLSAVYCKTLKPDLQADTLDFSSNESVSASLKIFIETNFDMKVDKARWTLIYGNAQHAQHELVSGGSGTVFSVFFDGKGGGTAFWVDSGCVIVSQKAE